MALIAVSGVVQIRNLQDLHDAVKAHVAVVVPHWESFRKPKPAAFMIHLPGERLLWMFNSGMYVYYGKYGSRS
jgi:hypothetical protein